MLGCVLCGNLNTPGIEKPHHPCQVSNGQPCTPCRQMKQLEDQISEETIAIQKMLDSVKQKLARHRELGTQVNHLHNPIILRVPLEIASSIFHFYVLWEWSETNSCIPAAYYNVASPLTLGAVCRSWRQIAWSTPQLWNSISVVLDPLKFPSRCEVVREWLGRSGQLPLYIEICNYHYDRDYQNDIATYSNKMERVINIINGYSRRWYELNLRRIPSFLISHLVGDSQAVCVPILRALRIYDTVQGSHNDQFRLNNVRPAPTKVRLHGFRLRAVHVGWNNITEVELMFLHVEECIEVLRRSPQLLQYTIEHVLPRQRHSPWKIPETPIIHPLLRLSVCHYHESIDNYNQDMEIFFNSFILPDLQYLRYGDNDFPGWLESDSLKSLFRRSTCPLTELSLEACFTDIEINDLLGATPSLRILELVPWNQRDDYSADGLFRLLASTSNIAHDQRGSFLPSLETIKYCPTSPVPWNLVSGIFGPASEMNKPHRRPLHKLQLSIGWLDELGRERIPYIDKETIHRLLELIDNGVSREFGIMDDDSNDLLKLSMEHHGITYGSRMTSNL